VATWWFQVAGARPRHAVVTATVTASTVNLDSGRSLPSSRSSQVRVGHRSGARIGQGSAGRGMPR
jgi:hypothetical protein